MRLAGGGLFLELQPAVRFPLIPFAFFGNNLTRPIYEIPRIALGLNLAAGITF
jgi:hypothetical protein